AASADAPRRIARPLLTSDSQGVGSAKHLRAELVAVGVLQVAGEHLQRSLVVEIEAVCDPRCIHLERHDPAVAPAKDARFAHRCAAHGAPSQTARARARTPRDRRSGLMVSLAVMTTP